MSVKREFIMRMKLCVIAGACLLTASMTWILAKRTYEKKEALSTPPLNMWKIALITIGMIWIMKIIRDGFRWIRKKLRILELIQNAHFHIPPTEFHDDTEVSKRGFNRSLGAPRQRAMAAMGTDEPK